FKKRIFGDFLGASRKAQLSPKLLACRGDIPASGLQRAAKSKTGSTSGKNAADATCMRTRSYQFGSDSGAAKVR
ncbi:MAG: hypothetical protein RR855_13740, partial [Comamonas sp.]